MLAPPDNPAQLFRPKTRIEDDGTVEGYASLFGEIDAARDMVMPGAFARTLRQRGIRRVPMLFQHDPAEPVGVWLELFEDFRGLRARGKLIPDVVRARELIALVRAGAVDGLSIGFRTVKGRVDPTTRVRKLLDIDLWEISIVTFPLLAGARVRAKALAPSLPRPARARAEREFTPVAEQHAAGRPLAPVAPRKLGQAARNSSEPPASAPAIRPHQQLDQCVGRSLTGLPGRRTPFSAPDYCTGSQWSWLDMHP